MAFQSATRRATLRNVNVDVSRALEPWLKQVGPGAAMAALAQLDPQAAVFVVDADRDVVFWSEGAERLLGIPAQEALGQSCLSSQRCATCLAGCDLERRGTLEGVPLEVFHADGHPLKLRKFAQAFHGPDGAFLGGGMRIAPQAQYDDGRLDVLVVEAVGAAKIIANIPRLILGKLADSPHVQYLRSAAITLSGDAEIQCDGEPVGRLPARVRVIHNAIRVMIDADRVTAGA